MGGRSTYKRCSGRHIWEGIYPPGYPGSIVGRNIPTRVPISGINRKGYTHQGAYSGINREEYTTRVPLSGLRQGEIPTRVPLFGLKQEEITHQGASFRLKNRDNPPGCLFRE